jgi:multimeric flavodoxin WrbA
LGIVGSPRRRGNTEILVDAVLQGAKEAGAVVEMLILNELDIAPCRACEICLATQECVQQDDMAQVLTQMQHSDVWVLGTPIFFCGPSAQFKTFIDRWYHQEQIVRFKDRRVILTIPLGAADANIARHTVGMVEGFTTHLQMDLFATIVAPGVWDYGKVKEEAHILTAARQAGSDAILNTTKISPPVV